MSDSRARRRGLCTILGCLVGSWFFALSALAAGTGGGGLGGARVGATGVYSGYAGGFGGPRTGASIIRHGSTGFSIYSQRGVTRVIGEPPVSKTILLPGRERARIVGDGTGGAYLFGAPGNHRILGNRPVFDDHGP